MIINKRDLYENVGESEELFIELIKIYLEDAPIGYQKVKDAIEKKNFEELLNAAHGVKGSSMSINAEDYAEVARQIELAGKEHTTDLTMLEKEFDNQYNILICELNKILE